jgi:hypothetical protein
MYTDFECGGEQLQKEFMDDLKGAARSGYAVLIDVRSRPVDLRVINFPAANFQLWLLIIYLS